MKPIIQKSLVWTVILSESSHVFCCVLPTVISLVSLLAGMGVVVAMPASLLRLHDLLHEWELPMIAASGAVLLLGWLATWYSDRIDCHSSGCAHGACAPKKDKAHLVLKIATLLFLLNIAVYFGVHRSGIAGPEGAGHHHDHADHRAAGHAHHD